jgi:predicted transport protein
MTALERAITEVLARTERGSMNESNTKVLLVEPILEALGWDTKDLDRVTREHQVFDGTFLDYALIADTKPALFVEAKAWGGRINDPKWTAQAINYANNEGVVWCALTDGVIYRVFKTNEPVDMARKLVFEVDLREVTDPDARQRLLQQLHLLSREQVMAGQLDALGSRLFDEARVRRALEGLFNEAPTRLITLIREQLPEGERRLDPKDIRKILQRVGKGLTPSNGLPREATVAAAASAASTTPVTAATQKPRTRASRNGDSAGRSIEDYFADKPQVVLDLYTQLHERIMALSADVERVLKKQYVGYRIGKVTFCSVIVLKGRLKLILNLDPSRVTDHPTARDVTGVGHWGVGDVQVELGSEESLDELLPWISEAAAAASR